MKAMTRILFLALAALLVPSAALAQGARTPSCACGKPATVPIQWDIRHGDPLAQQAAQQSLATWNQYVDVHQSTIQAVGVFDTGNGRNEIGFYDLATIPGFDENVVGVMFPQPQSAFGNFNACPAPVSVVCGSSFFEVDVLINSSFDWHVSRPNIDDPREAGYYHSTAIHEIGHAMGFHHNFKNVSTMNYYQDFAGQYVSLVDVLAARAQFPTRTKTVSDLGTYPFSYNSNQQSGSGGRQGITVANASPSSVAPGGQLLIKNWTAENLGTSGVSAARLRFFLSTDKTITTSDISLGGYRWDTLPLANWSEEYEGDQFTIPAGTPAGTYYVGAIIGSGDSNFVTDALTYNNSWFLPNPITVTGGSSSTCVSSGTQACLSNDRFGVSVRWRTSGGQTGDGQAIEYTPDSALFWFFGSTNIEMLTKIIDACSFSNSFWFFGAATTNVEYMITVRDYKTGQTKTYFNPLNNLAAAIGDTNAFKTCP